MAHGMAGEAGNAGEAGDLAPGATRTITLRLAPGHHALVGNLPGHDMGGKRTDLTVTESRRGGGPHHPGGASARRAGAAKLLVHQATAHPGGPP